MKNLLKIVLALALISATAFANNGENGTMDKLTNDEAFANTSALFKEATSDTTDPAASLLAGIVTVPSAVVESVIWIVVLPFNAIKTGMED